METFRFRSLSIAALCSAIVVVSPSLSAAEPTSTRPVDTTQQITETVDLGLRAQDGGTGQLDDVTVAGGSGLSSGSSGSLGSLGSSTDHDTEPGTDDSATATGSVEFAERTITLADDDAEFTVSRPDDTAALENLLRLGRGASFLAPMEVAAAPGVAEQGVTMSFSFDSPISGDEFYSIMFFDEDAQSWSAVETALSADRTTLTATVDHLSLWTAIRSGYEAAKPSINVGLNGIGNAAQTVADGFTNVIKKLPENIYRTSSSIFGEYADTPTCTGDTPDWLLTGKNAIDTSPSDFAAPVKFCAGSVPGDPDRLEIKAVVNRTTPFFLDIPRAHVEVLGDLSIDSVIGTALDLTLDPASGMYKTWSNLGTGILLPGQESTLRISKEAFDAGGGEFRLHAAAVNPAAGALFRGTSLALGDAADMLGSTLALITTGQCLGNLITNAYQSTGDVHGMIAPMVSCAIGAVQKEINTLKAKNVISETRAKNLLTRLSWAFLVAHVSQTLAEMIMDYVSGARTRTINMYADGMYDNPVTVDPGADIAGPGVAISNSQAVGSESQFGRTTHMFGDRSSWVLSTGLMDSIENTPSTQASTHLGGPGNTELSALSGGPTYDAATYRFMVTPTGSKLHIEYAFATEEFPQYVGSGYNDVMAIYVNGENCAVVPETGEPITVNTVNTITNSHWFADNRTGQVSDNLAFNGTTKGLTCTADVTPGQQIEVLIAVADTGDHVLDSAVALVDGGIRSTD